MVKLNKKIDKHFETCMDTTLSQNYSFKHINSWSK